MPERIKVESHGTTRELQPTALQYTVPTVSLVHLKPYHHHVLGHLRLRHANLVPTVWWYDGQTVVTKSRKDDGCQPRLRLPRFSFVCRSVTMHTVAMEDRLSRVICVSDARQVMHAKKNNNNLLHESAIDCILTSFVESAGRRSSALYDCAIARAPSIWFLYCLPTSSPCRWLGREPLCAMRSVRSTACSSQNHQPSVCHKHRVVEFRKVVQWFSSQLAPSTDPLLCCRMMSSLRQVSPEGLTFSTRCDPEPGAWCQPQPNFASAA